jgi:hypothetical protein
MGGWPKGSSNANKWKNELKSKQATNWVIVQYSEKKDDAKAENETSKANSSQKWYAEGAH